VLVLLRRHAVDLNVCQPEFKPVKYFSIDRVFRNESLDATHLAEFHQVEGLIADYNLSLGDLMGVIQTFFNKIGVCVCVCVCVCVSTSVSVCAFPRICSCVGDNVSITFSQYHGQAFKTSNSSPRTTRTLSRVWRSLATIQGLADWWRLATRGSSVRKCFSLWDFPRMLL
jgi:hypothetical protein